MTAEGWIIKVKIYVWLVVIGMLVNETEFTAVASDIIEYTMPFMKEYIWSVLNTSVMRVSVCCFDLSNLPTVRVSIVAKDDTSIFD